MRSTLATVLALSLLCAAPWAGADEESVAEDLRDSVRALLRDVADLQNRLRDLDRDVTILEQAQAELRAMGAFDRPLVPTSKDPPESGDEEPRFDTNRWFERDGLIWPRKRTFQHKNIIGEHFIDLTGRSNAKKVLAQFLETQKVGTQDYGFRRVLVSIEAPIQANFKQTVTFKVFIYGGTQADMDALKLLATQYEIFVDGQKLCRGLGTQGQSHHQFHQVLWQLPIRKVLDMIRSDDVVFTLGGSQKMRLEFQPSGLEAMRDFATWLQ